MSDLADLLERAARIEGGSFSSDDVARKVHRRRLRRRVMGAILGAAAIALGSVGLVDRLRNDKGDTSVVANGPSSAPGSVSPQLLMAERWVALEFSGVKVSEIGILPTMTFAPNGRFGGYTACNQFAGEWSLEMDRLEASGVQSTLALCPSAYGDVDALFLRLLRGGPTLKTIDGQSELQMRLGEEFVVFVPLDQLGLAPASDQITGQWKTAEQTDVNFEADGTLSFGPCGGLGQWSLQEGRLTVTGIDAARVPSCAASEGLEDGRLLDMFSHSLELHLNTSGALYLTDDQFVVSLRRPG